MGAAADVYSKAPVIIQAFDAGTTIRSKAGKWLAIPTDQAPKKGTDGKRISPSNFPESRFGELRFVYRRSGSSLLVVDGVKIGKSGRAGKQLKNRGKTKTGRYKKGVVTVVMFVLVPQVSLRKRLNIARAARVSEGRLGRTIIKHWNRLDPL